MARIPRAAQLGLDPSAAQNTRGVVDIPIPDFSGQRAGAEALDSVGKAMLEFGNKLQKEKEDHELVKADADMRVRMDKARQVIELDPETPDAAIPQRWKQESELIIKEVGGGISSSRARELWEIRARGVQGEGDVWSQNLLRKRQVDKVGGAYITMASEAEEMAGDPSISPETYASKLDGLRALTAQHLAGGFIGDEEAAKRVALLESYAVKDVKMRWSAGVLAVARTGDFDGAEKMIDDAKGLSVAERESALSSVGRERSLQEKEKADNQRAMGNAMEVDILDGRVTRSQIDEAAALGTINPNDAPVLIRALRAEDDRRKAAALAASTLSPAQMRAWSDQSASWKGTLLSPSSMPTDVFMGDRNLWAPNHQAKYNSMTPDDQRAIDNEQIKLRDGRGTYEGVNRISGQLTDVAQRVADPSWGISLTPTQRKADPQAAARADKLIGEIWAQASTLSNLNSDRPLTPDQINQAVAVALKKAGETKSEFMDWQLFAREVDPDGRIARNAPQQRADEMRRYDTADYNRTFAELKAAAGGEDPSSDEVTELMMRRRNKGQ